MGAELRRRGVAVSWMGRQEGMERTIAEQRDFPYLALAARPLTGKAIWQKLSALAVLAGSALVASKMIRKHRVAVTLGTGGYVSAPAVLGSYLARRPALLLEPNAVAGSANRWLSRFARLACVGYEDTARELHCPGLHTGVPVRPEFFEPRPLASSTLLVLGGSQGAMQINQLMPEVLERLARGVPDLRLVHQVGRDHVEAVQAGYRARSTAAARVEVTPFIDDMAAAMQQAGLIVSRAGAVTIAEIAAAGRPAVLIPLAGAAGHQRANAELLASAGAAVVVAPEEVDEARLAHIVEELLVDEPRRRRMAEAARRLAHSDAARSISDAIEKLGRAA